MSAKVLGVGVSGTAGYEWQVGLDWNEGGSKSEEVSITHTLGPITLRPGQGRSCKILVHQGEGDFPYTSTVTHHLEGGSVVQYQEPGTLKTVQYSEAIGSCADADQPIAWDLDANYPPKDMNMTTVKVG